MKKFKLNKKKFYVEKSDAAKLWNKKEFWFNKDLIKK